MLWSLFSFKIDSKLCSLFCRLVNLLLDPFKMEAEEDKNRTCVCMVKVVFLSQLHGGEVEQPVAMQDIDNNWRGVTSP